MLKDLKVSVWVDTLTGCLCRLSKEPIPIFWRHGPLRLRISSLCCARGLSSVGVFLWTCRCTRQWEMIKDGQMWFKDRRFLSTVKEFRYIEVQGRTGFSCKLNADEWSFGFQSDEIRMSSKHFAGTVFTGNSMLFYDFPKVTGSKRIHFDQGQFIAETEVKPTPRCDLTGQTIVVTCPTACNITSEVGLLAKLC